MASRIDNEELRATRDELELLQDRLLLSVSNVDVAALATHMRVLCWHIDQLWRKADDNS